MSKIAEKMRAATSKPAAVPALLVLEDGAVFAGTSCGAPGEAFGEICFNTSLESYLEIVTDPSYAGQIVALTYPQVGNYGVNADDAQAERPALRALVVRDLCPTPSSWRSQESLGDYLTREGVVAIEGIDTRALVRHIRDHGAQRAVVSTTDADVASLLEKVRRSPSLVGVNLAADVSCDGAYSYTAANLPASHGFALAAPAEPRFKVVVYHCGVKRSILDGLVASGCELTVVPWDTPAEEVLAMGPDGVFLSNGPGDPEAVGETYRQAEKLLGRVEVTAQNHGFCPCFQSLGALVPELSGGATEHVEDLREWGRRGIAPVVANERFGRIRLTHVNLDDGTAEGFAFLDVPAFSVQYHPEAAPGPTDAHYLFTAFARLMEGRDDYLDIDIATDRLSGWKFGSTAEGEVA